ncbi:MAG: hypothetical protein EOP49_47570 [Sphingobacteriales bacterium]|nr:MAG: hypothetical protein EOP49_47570 [Sphingobacteriales bacterium]
MNFEDFRNSLKNETAPSGLSPILLSLWYEGKGDWDGSHNIAQDIHTSDGSWIHAYLHRKEGDPGNAAYWYRKAGKPIASGSFEKEWETIVKSFL